MDFNRTRSFTLDNLKIRVYSDLHEDQYARYASTKGEKCFWYPPELPDDKETILVLAGDLWVGTKWIEWAGFSWISKVAQKFKHVIIVLGNHDLWANGDLTITNCGDKCNSMLSDYQLHNVTVLDKSTFSIGNYIFVGATLWTDMNHADPLAMMHVNTYMYQDGKCKYRTGENGLYEKFTSERWINTHIKHRDYIAKIASDNKDKKVVVVTHHAPLWSLVCPMYIGDSANCYYVSDLSDIIIDNQNIVAWIYGHVHCRHDDYMLKTRLINNAVGYIGELDESTHEVIIL
jgi:predicted MPP superfamily phosphohydrolase